MEAKFQARGCDPCQSFPVIKAVAIIPSWHRKGRAPVGAEGCGGAAWQGLGAEGSREGFGRGAKRRQESCKGFSATVLSPVMSSSKQTVFACPAKYMKRTSGTSKIKFEALFASPVLTNVECKFM